MTAAKDFWNARYARDEYVYGEDPNEFFKNTVDSLAPGKLLLPCEGEGRNAVYAALRNWEVDAFDQSSAGQQKCLLLADKMDVSVNYVVADATDFEAGLEKYDLVALSYAHFLPQIRRPAHRKLAGALKKGGILMLEAFNPRQLGNTSGGPVDISMLYTAGMLREDFAMLKIRLLEEVRIEIAEGKLHTGPADVVRLIAVK